MSPPRLLTLRFVLLGLAFALPPALAQETWLPRSSGTTAHLWGVTQATAPDLFVAVGEQGTILTSPDGTTWTPRSSGFPTRRFLGVAYGRGLFVAVGGTEPLSDNLAVIVTSPDGITWTSRATTGVRFNNVAFGNGTFVAVNDVGDLWSSLDGLTWKPGAAGPGRYLRGLAYGAPTFVTTGLSGITSTYDGTALDNRVPTAGQLEGVAWGRNQFVAVGTAGLTYTSRDGLAWTQQPTTTALTAYSAAFFNNQFIAVGNTGIVTSFDGTAWTTRSVSLAPDVILLGIAASPTSAVAVGRFGTILQSPAATTAPSIATPPTPVDETEGGNIAFRVTATGSLPLGYQWRKNGTPITGATGDILFLPRVNRTQAGGYSCQVSNAAGIVTTGEAALTVEPSFVPSPRLTFPAIIDLGSASPYREVRDGDSISLGVNATGSPSLVTTLTTPAGERIGLYNQSTSTVGVTPTATGIYTVTATDPAGHTTTKTLFIRVMPSAPYSAYTWFLPANIFRPIISLGGSHTFSAMSQGTRPFSYQWFRNDLAISGATEATYTIRNATMADAGTYTVVVTNPVGSSTMPEFGVSVATPPSVTIDPIAQTVAVGARTLFRALSSNGFIRYPDGDTTRTPNIRYQWKRNGAQILGANLDTYLIDAASESDAGTYTVDVFTYLFGLDTLVSSATSAPATLTVLPRPSLSNLSVRTTLAASQLLTVGFTMTNGTKPVLVRAVGPGLTALGVPGAMADPRLNVFDSTSTLVAANDNWSGSTAVSSAMNQVGAFALPGPFSFDAALVRSTAGSSTVQVSGPAAGNVLLEVYDAGPASSSRLTNLSALNTVGTGPDVLIAGFTLAGTGTRTVLLRGIGPSLTPLGVPAALADPKLELFDSRQTKLAENDTYAPTLAPTFAALGAFPLLANSRDAALLVTLAPGAYTAVVSGVDNTSGTALVEVYEVP